MTSCYVAVHKQTGKFFAGKKVRTHIGYPKLHYLKSAIRCAKEDLKDYEFKKFLPDGSCVVVE